MDNARDIINNWEANKPFVNLTTDEFEVLFNTLIKATHTMHKITQSRDIRKAKKEALDFLKDFPFGDGISYE